MRHSTQVGRGISYTCVLINSNNLTALTAYVHLFETILLEPHLDSLLVPCFSHCLQKYLVYHSLIIYDVCFYTLYGSFKDMKGQVTANEHQSPKPLNYS